MEEQTLTSVNEVILNVTSYLPNLLAGIVVLGLGAVLAWICAKLAVRLLIVLRLDRIVGRLGWSRALEKGDVRHSLFELLGALIGALIFLVFLENAIVIWRLTVLSELLEKIVVMIPKLMGAAVILLVGWGVAVGVSKAVRRALYQEEFKRARLVSRITHAAILVVAVAIVLVQLDIAVVIVTGAFLITYSALALSFVLAFGLGSKRAVEAMWDERLRRGTDSEAKPSRPVEQQN